MDQELYRTAMFTTYAIYIISGLVTLYVASKIFKGVRGLFGKRRGEGEPDPFNPDIIQGFSDYKDKSNESEENNEIGINIKDIET